MRDREFLDPIVASCVKCLSQYNFPEGGSWGGDNCDECIIGTTRNPVRKTWATGLCEKIEMAVYAAIHMVDPVNAKLYEFPMCNPIYITIFKCFGAHFKEWAVGNDGSSECDECPFQETCAHFEAAIVRTVNEIQSISITRHPSDLIGMLRPSGIEPLDPKDKGVRNG